MRNKMAVAASKGVTFRLHAPAIHRRSTWLFMAAILLRCLLIPVGPLYAEEERCDPARFSSDIRWFFGSDNTDLLKHITARTALPIPPRSKGTHIVAHCLATDQAGRVVGARVEMRRGTLSEPRPEDRAPVVVSAARPGP